MAQQWKRVHATRNQTPEKHIQATIERWLANQPNLIAMHIDNNARFDPVRKIFKPKPKNYGSLFFSGIPDIIVFDRQLGLVALEVKSPKGYQRPDQKDLEASLKSLGGKYVVVRSLDEVINYFSRSHTTLPLDVL